MARTSGKLKWYGKAILIYFGLTIVALAINYIVHLRWDDRLPNLDKSYDSHVMLRARGYGDSFSLTGDVMVTVIFVDDPAAEWTHADCVAIMTHIMEQNILLKQAAKEYGTELNLEARYKYVDVDVEFDINNYQDWAVAAVENAGYSMSSGSSRVKADYGVKEAPYFLCTPHDGRAFAKAVHQDGYFEYGVLFQSNPTAYAHELCHLFGAVDYYYPQEVKKLAEECFGSNLMLEGDELVIDPLTAYLIGWTDEVSAESLRFLDETAWITETQYREFHRQETFTGTGTRTTESYTYTGQMVRGMPHGTGRQEMADGSVYEGEFYYGCWQGYGKYTWENGNWYEGQFEDGRMHGQGSYTWSDGPVYEGQFFEGKLHGQGKMTYPDGKQITGTWENGEYVQ